jgi:hypothetical protein
VINVVLTLPIKNTLNLFLILAKFKIVTKSVCHEKSKTFQFSGKITFYPTVILLSYIKFRMPAIGKSG